MRGTVIKVHPTKYSRTEGAFIRLEFMMEDGEWAKTDIVTKYRNYSRWQPIIKAGAETALDGLLLRKKGEVDGDSYPRITHKRIEIKKRETPKETDQQLSLINEKGGEPYGRQI